MFASHKGKENFHLSLLVFLFFFFPPLGWRRIPLKGGESIPPPCLPASLVSAHGKEEQGGGRVFSQQTASDQPTHPSIQAAGTPLYRWTEGEEGGREEGRGGRVSHLHRRLLLLLLLLPPLCPFPGLPCLRRQRRRKTRARPAETTPDQEEEEEEEEKEEEERERGGGKGGTVQLGLLKREVCGSGGIRKSYLEKEEEKEEHRFVSSCCSGPRGGEGRFALNLSPISLTRAN